MRTFLISILSFYLLEANSQTFTLKSVDLGGQFENAQFLNNFGCNGGNISPQIFWENPPEDTKSFAITMYDEDAPSGSGWWHWVIFDINKSISEIKRNIANLKNQSIPNSHFIQSVNDFGIRGYGGPCPPVGEKPHKYVLTVYALKVDSLGLNEDSNPALVGYYINQNTIEKASLIIYAKR